MNCFHLVSLFEIKNPPSLIRNHLQTRRDLWAHPPLERVNDLNDIRYYPQVLKLLCPPLPWPSLRFYSLLRLVLLGRKLSMSTRPASAATSFAILSEQFQASNLDHQVAPSGLDVLSEVQTKPIKKEARHRPVLWNPNMGLNSRGSTVMDPLAAMRRLLLWHLEIVAEPQDGCMAKNDAIGRLKWGTPAEGKREFGCFLCLNDDHGVSLSGMNCANYPPWWFSCPTL